MPSELCCLTCTAPLTGKRTKFCRHKCAMKWHNSQAPWRERKDRHKRNAARKAEYRADPEFWKNKARAWRAANPERAAFFANQSKEKYWANPWKRSIIAAKGRAIKFELPFDLTFEWGESRWTGFCELTKIPFAPRYGAPSSIFSPSIDRIIPSAGYVQENCRFVLLGVNGLKHDGDDAAMYFVAAELLLHKPHKILEGTPT